MYSLCWIDDLGGRLRITQIVNGRPKTETVRRSTVRSIARLSAE